MPKAQCSIQERFSQLDGAKGDLHQRCEDYARWTIPNLFPLDHTDNSTEMTRDWQSIGARAVNHLANKIALVLFPAGRPFFRLDPEQDLRDAAESAGLSKTQLEEALSAVEREAPMTLQRIGARSTLVRALKELIALGNVCLYYDEKNEKLHAYNIRNYAVQRDLSGNVTEAVLRDCVSFKTLPDGVRERYMRHVQQNDLQTDENVNLYTYIFLEGGKFQVKQAVESMDIDELSRGSYPKKDLPWIFLTWEWSRGKDYGSGLVEDFAGDFQSLSTLSESFTLGAAVAADVKFLVDPAGQTNPSDLNNAETGEYVYGREEDIAAFTVDKNNDWQIVNALIGAIEKRLGLAFLLNSAVTRDAERVTAEEIRFQAQELEGSLGGVYSRLAEDLQLPISKIAIQANKAALPLDGIELVILTGMESLSRTTELEQVLGFINDLALLAQIPDEARIRLRMNDVMAIMAMGRGLDRTKFLEDEQVVQQRIQAGIQQQQQMAMQQQAADTAGKVAVEQAKPRNT